jgi:hypothetical protein
MLICSALASTTGCLIPTSLQEAPAQATNNRPVFVSSNAVDHGTDPPFGFVALDSLSPNFVVDDMNALDPSDTVRVRLFKQGDAGPSSRIYLELEFVLHRLADPNHPFRYVGGFDDGSQLMPCAQYTTSAVLLDLFAIVADRPFNTKPNTDPTLAPGGLTDENHWEFRCQ